MSSEATGQDKTTFDFEVDAMECSQCQKTDTSLKQCSRCHVAKYCDRGCQKAHWKTHKKECAHLAGQSTGGDSNSGTTPPRSDPAPFTAIYHGNFLHDRPEKQTFQILIDTLRMRQEDAYNLDADTMNGSIYNGEATSRAAFRDFLKRAKQVPGFLPPWWSEQKAQECVLYGLREDHCFSLAHAVEKADVQQEWKDKLMPMKLRMLAEKVYGRGPGGQSGAEMLAMMMANEGGQPGFVLDLAR